MNEPFGRWNQVALAEAARRMMISDASSRATVTIGDALRHAHDLRVRLDPPPTPPRSNCAPPPRDLGHPCWHTVRYAAWAGAVTFLDLGESLRLEDLRATVEAADGWLAEAGDVQGR